MCRELDMTPRFHFHQELTPATIPPREWFQDVPGGSDGKVSAYNAGDLGSISGFGRSPGEGNGYPLQYIGIYLVPQTVRNLPAMQETWVRSLGWEDPLEEGMATHSNILA